MDYIYGKIKDLHGFNIYLLHCKSLQEFIDLPTEFSVGIYTVISSAMNLSMVL
jgi:hypothetical protein